VPFRIKAEWINRKFGVELPFGEHQKAVKVKSLEIFERSLKPNPGLLELLAALKKDSFRLALASNNSADSINAILGNLGLGKTFEAVVESSQVKKPKPAPDVYLAAAGKLSIPPDECVAVEDTALGVTAAKAAGMKCIAMPNPLDMHGDFSVADMVVASLKEITPKIVRSLEGGGIK